MPSLLGVELARVGTWDLVIGGRKSFTAEDFTDAIAASTDPDFGAPGIRPGHTDPRFDGEPSLGRVANLRMVGDRLVGDLVDLPGWLADRVGAAYPHRSIEGYTNVTGPSGQRYRLVLTSLALLGVAPPAMSGLADLPAAIAAGAELVAAASDSMGLADTPPPSSTTAGETRSIVFATRDDSPTGGQPMPDLSALRERLGLAADVPDDDVIRQAAERIGDAPAGDTPPPPTPSGSGTGTGGDSQAQPTPPAPATPPVTAEQVPVAAGLNNPDGTVVVDAAQWQAVQAQAAAGAHAAATMRRQERDRFIGSVMASGRLAPSNTDLRASLEREWERDPVTAQRIAAGLAVVAPTVAIGDDGAPEDVAPDQGWTEAEMRAHPELRGGR